MSQKIHNVRTRQKEAFSPLRPGQISMYVCGLTVYDHAHLGHARTAVSFEVIRRWLERHHEVRFVQNVTDVEDKIINRAKELGVSPRKHSAKWDRECLAAMERLGVREPDEAPHVTTSIPDIIAYIETIVGNGHAYVTDQGNVYFDVPGYATFAEAQFPEHGYGHLSRRDYKEMAAGTRKDVESDKRHPADFALWKAGSDDEHPDANWESPWGVGRPGWHIECSLMSTRSLGYPIDIHGGGQDLIFPHHENEIAQSQANTESAPFVTTWMHTGFLNVDGQKMSKSLGNFIVLTEMLDEMESQGLDPEALRFYFVQTHYRSKIDFSRKGLQEAATAVERLRRTRRLLWETANLDRIGCADVDPGLLEATTKLQEDFGAAMADDFHTPSAIAALFAFQRAANTALEGDLGSEAASQALEVLQTRGRVLTLFPDDLQVEVRDVPQSMTPLLKDLGIPTGSEAEVMAAILDARARARASKDWGTADKIRDALQEAGYVVEDTPNGARWSHA